MCWLKGLRWAGILLLLELACVFSTTHSLDKISEWLIQLALQSTWIGSWDSIYQIDVSLSDVCGCRHSHLTLPQWREDVMGSSQALIWQGIPASETRRWQLSEAAHSAKEKSQRCKDRPLLCQYHGCHLILIRASTVRLVLYRPQTSLCIRREKEMQVSENLIPGAVQRSCDA